MEDLGCRILLGNTYHLAYKPTGDILEKFGGSNFFWGGYLTEKGYINSQAGSIIY